MKFQVTLEDFPSENFTNVSPEKCWEMVLQRLRERLVGQSSLGERGQLPLQSINGLQMFGFLSPHIIQVKHFHPSLTAFILGSV